MSIRTWALFTAIIMWVNFIAAIIYSYKLPSQTFSMTGFDDDQMTVVQSSVQIYLKVYVYIFFFISALSDTAQACRKEYMIGVASGLQVNWLLWLQYGIGNPLMIGVTTYLSGMADIWAHLFAMALMFACIAKGPYFELASSIPPKLFAIVYGSTILLIITIATWVSFLRFASVAPGFVIAIEVLITLDFITFAGIPIYLYRKGNPETAAKAYKVLSCLSTTLLGHIYLGSMVTMYN